MIELAPSLLAADPMQLGREIENMLKTGVRLLHYDVMDAHFVPNLSFGPFLLEEIHRRYPQCRLDVHLMMDQPERFLRVFADAGAESLTVHREIREDMHPLLDEIKRLGVRRGLSIKPETEADTLKPYLKTVDSILIMTVEPGFGGQEFQPGQMEKIRALRSWGFEGTIAVDGGVNLENAPLLTKAGADRLIMGTTYFHAKDPMTVVRAVKELS